MKIRRDTVSISSVLFTIALFGLVPPFAKIAFTGHDKAAFQRLDWGLQAYSRLMDSFSIASLAIVLIRLIVTWAGYINKVRWTWFVMFVIVWGWAFPVLVLPDVVVPLYRGADSSRRRATELAVDPCIECSGVSDDYGRAKITKYGNTNEYSSVHITFQRPECKELEERHP
jgi:hypothetical protein